MESNQYCKSVKPLISAYYDNELSPEETLTVKQHLENCPDCNNEYEYMKKIGDCIRNCRYLPYNNINTWQKISSRLDELDL